MCPAVSDSSVASAYATHLRDHAAAGGTAREESVLLLTMGMSIPPLRGCEVLDGNVCGLVALPP